MLKKQHQVFVALMCAADGVAIAVACYVAWTLRRLVVEGFWPRSWENWLIREPRWIIAVPLGLVALGAFGLYQPRRDRPLAGEWFQILKASAVTLGLLVFVLWAAGNEDLIGRGHYGDAGHIQLPVLAVCLPLFLAAQRTAVRSVLRGARRRGYNLRHVAVIGVGRLGQIVCRTLERNPWTGLHVNYFVSHHAQARRATCEGKPVLAGLADLERALTDRPVDAVYLAIPNAGAAIIPKVLQRLEKFTLDVRIVPDVHPRFVPQSMMVNELDGMPILSYRENTSSGLGGFSKRALDAAGSLAGLLVLAPLMALIAVVVKASSPGPVIFKQRRVSLGAKTFMIYKFRTMYEVEDEQGEAAWTTRDDPRITGVGRWLRRTSLDELPQLINVLRGEMSLVGPRPERPELIERFRENWKGYMLRQHVKAGITGWAQVNGHRGDTGLRKRLQYDLFYVKNWSLWFDVRILWLTLFRGFVHRNAH